ncbi:MAG TPA: aminotransferase class III-fold pyridoxal phosphate-dependent enzyme [Herpetosiphonaceae bacterium]
MSTMPPATQTAIAENTWLHFYQMEQLQDPAQQTVIVRGENARVWDQNDREYIDALAGLFCVNVGYGRREIADAVCAQIQQIAYVSPFSFPNLPAAELSATLAELAPLGDTPRAFFTSGGSEAVESALKIAKQYQRKLGFAGRTKTISRRYAYHGTTMGALSVNGLPGIRNQFAPLVPGARHVPIPHRYRCNACQLASACTRACTDEIEALIEFEGPETIAAIIMEPVQNSGGAIVPPPDYYRAVREICDRYGILLIMDEVITAFGRIGAWFGSEIFGVEPDIITIAKGMTSGYMPMGAALARKAVADVFLGNESDKLMHGLTYGGHPVAAAAANANIAIIEREGLNQRAHDMGNYLMAQLHLALDEHPNIGEIRGMGLFVGLELVRDRQTKQPLQEEHLMSWLSDHLRRRGVICRADDRLDPVIQLAPPLTIPRADIDEVVGVLAEVLHLLGQRVGSLPRPVQSLAALPNINAVTANAAESMITRAAS